MSSIRRLRLNCFLLRFNPTPITRKVCVYRQKTRGSQGSLCRQRMITHHTAEKLRDSVTFTLRPKRANFTTILVGHQMFDLRVLRALNAANVFLASVSSPNTLAAPREPYIFGSRKTTYRHHGKFSVKKRWAISGLRNCSTTSDACHSLSSQPIRLLRSCGQMKFSN
jgi:hypothetical protein